MFHGNNFGSRRGVIGCALSHYDLWKQLVTDKKHDCYLVLEDDITLCQNFKARVDKKNKKVKLGRVSPTPDHQKKVELS